MTIEDERRNVVRDLKNEPTQEDTEKQAKFNAENRQQIFTDGDNI